VQPLHNKFWMLLLLFLLACAPVQAGTLGVDFLIAEHQASPIAFNFGWDFAVVNPVTVIALGALDVDGQYMNYWGPTLVGLWKDNGAAAPTLLASTLVSATDGIAGNAILHAEAPGTQYDVWRFHSITPVDLATGHYVLGAQGHFGYAFNVPLSELTVAPGITYLGERYYTDTFVSATDPLAYPNGGDNSYVSYFGPNLQFGEASSAPEPSTLLHVGGVALLAVAAATRRVRRRFPQFLP
jgi:MYXO-CTERM domain-containing protein